jgi:hypothetical protein
LKKTFHDAIPQKAIHSSALPRFIPAKSRHTPETADAQS